MLVGELYNARLNEVHWTDTYPKSFADFRSRYLKMVRAGSAHDLYVQFSNFTDNTMDRVAHTAPDHSDPVGVYGYPMAYVLSHPSDVWYGKGARYLRVLRDVSRNTLHLPSISTRSHAENTLIKMGLTYKQADTALDIAAKVYKSRITGTNKFAKMFISAAQVDLLSEPVSNEKPGMFSKGGPVYRVRTGAEQTTMFRQAGYDAIEDTGKTGPSAIINSREPEQIIFLTRAAFRVIEVVDLRSGTPLGQLPTMTTSDPDSPRIKRPLASALAKAMGDQIKEFSDDQSTATRTGITNRPNFYWTLKGRRIQITFDRHQSYYDNKKMGEKKHREAKLSDSFMTKVEIKTELGDINFTGDSEETFKDIIGRVVHSWQALQKNPKQTDWQPQDAKGFVDAEKTERDRLTDARISASNKKALEEAPAIIASIQYVADQLGLEFTPNDDEAVNARIGKTLDHFGNFIRHEGINNNTVDAFVAKWIKFETEDYEGTRIESILVQLNQISKIILAAAVKYKKLDYWLKSGDYMFIALKREINEVDA